MYRLKLFLISFLAVLVLALLISPYSNPGSVFYPLKRLQEKKFLSFKSGEARFNYLNTLADIRLNELSYLVNHKAYRQILTSSLRYSTQIGDLVNYTKSLNEPQKLEALKQKLVEHKKIAQSLYDNYPDKDDSERRYVLDAVHYLEIYLSQL